MHVCSLTDVAVTYCGNMLPFATEELQLLVIGSGNFGNHSAPDPGWQECKNAQRKALVARAMRLATQMCEKSHAEREFCSAQRSGILLSTNIIILHEAARFAVYFLRIACFRSEAVTEYASVRTQYWRIKCTNLNMFKYHHSMQSNGIVPACRVGTARNFAAMKIGLKWLVCALHRGAPEHQPQRQHSDEVIDYHGRSPTCSIYRIKILVWITTCVDVI